jgi:thiamine transport system substrate-binding protein
LALVAAACGGAPEGTTPPTTGVQPTPTTTAPATTSPPEVTKIVLMTHDSFAVSDDVLADFTARTGVEVEILRAGDAGAMVNQAILTKDNPLADVMFGIDNTFLSRALDEGIFEEYRPAGLDRVPDALELDPNGRVTPIDFGDVCLNYDRAAFDELGIPVPETLVDLTDPVYRGRLVVENPATSSPGLAFLMATVATFGEDGDYTWLDFWADLRENEVLVTSGWEEAYFSAFTPYGGDRPLVVSYASSPPAEVIFAEEPLDEAPTGVITGGCFRQIEFAGILTGTEKRDAAAQFIDFMLGVEFQEDIPLNMFVFPANQDAALPPAFVEHTQVPEDPAVLDPAVIDANRERWIEAWTEVVLP